MNNRSSNILYVLLVLLLVGWWIYQKSHNAVPQNSPSVGTDQSPSSNTSASASRNNSTIAGADITRLTSQAVVVPYIKQNHRLPNYYLTKNQARQQGWDPGKGDLCDVLPGHAIGGDVFTNREQLVPSAPGRRWFEADLNYQCGHRNADRLLFSNDGLVYITTDHYQTAQQQ